MLIYHDVRFEGTRTNTIEKSMIDTGASISMIPRRLADAVGAWPTSLHMTVEGVHKQQKTLPLAAIRISFPGLNGAGGQLLVAVSDDLDTPLIGMDILRPLGVSINAGTHQLEIRNEAFDAFRNLSAVLVGGVILAYVIDAVFGEQ